MERGMSRHRLQNVSKTLVNSRVVALTGVDSIDEEKAAGINDLDRKSCAVTRLEVSAF
jgi:hypothetical protein